MSLLDRARRFAAVARASALVIVPLHPALAFKRQLSVSSIRIYVSVGPVFCDSGGFGTGSSSP